MSRGKGRWEGKGKGQNWGACWMSSSLAVGVGFGRGKQRGGEEVWVGRGGKMEGDRGGVGGGIVTRELKVLLRSSLSPSNLHWS